MAQEKPIPSPVKFALSAIAGCSATTIIQPLDLVKTRMQVASPGTFRHGGHAMTSIVSLEGPSKLYTGLSAALLRQVTYGASRLAIFNILLERANRGSDQPPSLATKAGCGLIAGAVGSTIGNPAEVCLVRMTSDGRLPVGQRRGYTGVGNALTRIVQEEGISTLWKGCGPTIARAAVLNMAQLGTYSQVKEMLLNRNFAEGFATHVLAASCAGVVSSFASLPVDNIKTKIQNMKKDRHGNFPFAGARDCLVKSVKSEGLLSLWTGIGPYIVRISPHAIFCLVFLEQLTKAYRRLQ